MRKPILAIVCAGLALAGCSRVSENVFFNVSVHADRFEVQRRITLHNRITETDTIVAEGLCAFWPYPDHLRVVCKVGNGYTQDTFGLSPYVTFSVEQLDPIPVDVERRER